MGCWKQFVWQPHLSLVTPVVLHPKNPLGGRRSYDTAAISARPKILRFLLGLRRSSSCGRDCADGLLEAVCMATAFISRDPGLTAPQKSVGGAGATTPQPFRPRPKILRFLLGLRRSSSCGRDCADGA